MTNLELLLQIAAAVLAAVTALAIDLLTARRGLTPPGFAVSPLRRAAAGSMVAFLLWLGVFGALADLGSDRVIDLETLSPPVLFLLHGLMALTLAGWLLLGYGLSPPRGGLVTFARQLGLTTPRPLEDVGIGVLGGFTGLFGMFAVMMLLVSLLAALGAEEVLPKEAPEMVMWIGSLPVLVRIAVALSAGLMEEAFFRGFLQPRVGIGLSTGLFVFAHAGVQASVQLVGLAFLSLLLAYMVRWRQSIWPAVVAHAVFDLIQLLVTIPFARQFVPTASGLLGPL